MITKSAKKAYRQNIKRHTKNIRVKKVLHDVLKRYKKSIQAGNLKDAKDQLSKVYKFLDKAAKVNLIKKNKASRLKSRLTKLIAKK